MRMLGLLLIMLIIGGCEQPAQRVERSKVVVVAIDRTGSYGFVKHAMNNVADLVIKSGKPKDLWFFRYVSDRSYSDEEAIFTLKLPAMPSNSVNPFDPKARSLFAEAKRGMEHLKRAAASRLKAERPTQAPYTDIYGAVVKASEILSDYDTAAYSKVFIMATDLQDNLNRKGKFNLEGVKVIILMFESDVEPKATQERKAYWENLFLESKAECVRFFGPSVPMECILEVLQ